MKKLLKLAVTIVMILTITGCSSGPDKDYKTLIDSGYNLLVSYDFYNYYDEKGNCYNDEGEMIDQVRVIEKPENIFNLLLVNKEERYKLDILVNKKGEVTSLKYNNGEGYYNIDFKKIVGM